MIRRVSLILVAMLALILATALVVPATEGGSRWLARQGLALVPGDVRFDHLEGSFWSGLTLVRLRYHGAGTRVLLERARLEPDWSMLLNGALGIETLTVEGVRVALAVPATAGNADAGLPPAPDWPRVSLPLPVQVERLVLRDLVLRRGEEQHRLTRLALSGRAAGQTLDFHYLALQQQARHLSWRGSVRLAPPWRLDGELAWGLPLPPDLAATFGHPAAAGQARLEGPLNELSLRHQLHYPQPVRSRGELHLLARPLDHQLTHRWQQLRITPPGGAPLTLGPGRLNSRGAPGAYHLELRADSSTIPGLPPVRPRLRARGDGGGLRIDSLRLASDSGTLSASGALDWAGTLNGRLQLEGRAINPAWLDDRARGQLDFSGHVAGRLPPDAPLELELTLARIEGRLLGEPLTGSARLSLAGTDGARIHALELTSPHGRLRTRGRVQWAPRLRWALTLNGRALDPALLWPDWPGRLRLQASFSGSRPGKPGPELDLVVKSLDGTLRGAPVDGDGEFQLRGQHGLRGQLRLSVAGNRLEAHGQRNGGNDLEIVLEAPSLGALGPDLAGSLNGWIRIHGPAQRPRLDGHLEGRNLRLNELTLASATLKLASPGGEQRLELRTGPLRHREQPWVDRLELKGHGGLAEHRIQWTLERAQHRLSGTVTGGRAEDHWRGRLIELTLDGPLSGPWRQAEPAAVTLAPETARIATLCLAASAGPGRLCGRGEWQGAGTAHARLSANAVPLAPLATMLPADARLEGRLTGDAEWRMRAGRASGQLRVASPDGALLLGAERETPVRLPWQSWSARARLDGSDWRARTRLERGDGDFVDARVEHNTGPGGARLDGRLALRLSRLTWLELLIPRLRSPEGRLEGSLTLAGTPAQPVFDGELGLHEASVQIPGAGIALHELRLSARANAAGVLRLDGGARSGAGRVQLAGRLETDQAWPWPLRLTLRGRRFQVLDRPDARVLVNPDLALTLSGNEVRLSGELTVPEARLRPRQLPTRAVSLSRDAQLVHSPAPAPSTFQLAIDLGLSLGEQVSFQGFGLDARFTGQVRYRDRIDQLPRMTGRLSIAEGQYRAYGQHLRIERGNLLFEGAPANPGLDIVAVRPLPERETRVGLEVTGTLQNPRARVFSEPPLEESEAMALLLTGRPLSGASRAESDAILQAVSRYGLKKGAFLTDPLSESLGVELGVDASGTNEQTALTLGKQLSDRLYVRYSMGIFESLSAVMLRYSITPRLSLETRSSGEAQGVDLIYRLQAD